MIVIDAVCLVAKHEFGLIVTIDTTAPCAGIFKNAGMVHVSFRSIELNPCPVGHGLVAGGDAVSE